MEAFFGREGVGVGGECGCEVVCDSANLEDFLSAGPAVGGYLQIMWWCCDIFFLRPRQ